MPRIVDKLNSHKLSKVERMNSHKLSANIDIVELISQRRWSKLKQILKTSDPDFLTNNCHQQLRDGLIIEGQYYPSIVHFVCTLKPPLFVVKALVNANTESVYVSNTNLWCPLQMACHHEASAEVVHYLYCKNPVAAQQTDTYGRTALHLAVETQGYRRRYHVVETMNVVELMLQAYPFGVTLEDSNGTTALELAYSNDYIDEAVIGILNTAVMKERQKLGQRL